MKIHYDDEVDALYIQFDEREPDGVVEIEEGVNLDTTPDGKLTGIEIPQASGRINIDTIMTYSLELNKGVKKKKRLVG